MCIRDSNLDSENNEIFAASFGGFERNENSNTSARKINLVEEIPVKVIKEANRKVDSTNNQNDSKKNTKEIQFRKESSISKTEKKTPKKFFNKKPKKIKPFNLNSENPEDWKQIRGIGDGFSIRIIKYQSWLGGFHSADQLKEVYGLTDSLIQVITPYLQNTQNFKKIKVNEADVKAFGKHPYLEWKEANLIIKYRKHHYPLTPETFNQMIGISPETKRKISPYLDFSIESNIENTENQKSSMEVTENKNVNVEQFDSLKVNNPKDLKIVKTHLIPI